MKPSTLPALLLALTLPPALVRPVLADKAPPPLERDVKTTGAPDTTDAPDAKTAAGDAKGDAAPAAPPVVRIPDTRPARLPDGVFLGRLSGGGITAELRVTIVAGRVIEGAMRRPGGLPILDLRPVEGGDALGLRLQGSAGSEFVRVNGAFFDAERGAGRFDGVLGRVQAAGTWLLARR